MIDLRSDTVTRPTEGMRQAMYTADVGDDVYGEDPTLNRLQEVVANLLGKEAALFVPSGTMSNQIALRTHTQPGDEVICEYQAHIFNYESGAPGVLSGIQLHTLHGDHGILKPEQLTDALRPGDHHFAQSRLIALENTHNRAGGVIYPLEIIRDISLFAKKHKLFMHLDGARLMNACQASGISPKEYAQYFDSVSICLSKGLGAPVGSLLVGSKDFIHEAHRFRKMFGGGMRQAGMLAAAGLYALEHHVDRLSEDHKRAQELALTCLELGVLEDDISWTQTNIVMLSFPNRDAGTFAQRCRKENLLVSLVNDSRVRLVTHLDFDDRQLEQTMRILQRILR